MFENAQPLPEKKINPMYTKSEIKPLPGELEAAEKEGGQDAAKKLEQEFKTADYQAKQKRFLKETQDSINKADAKELDEARKKLEAEKFKQAA